jgi:hypothetical protein
LSAWQPGILGVRLTGIHGNADSIRNHISIALDEGSMKKRDWDEEFVAAGEILKIYVDMTIHDSGLAAINLGNDGFRL